PVHLSRRRRDAPRGAGRAAGVQRRDPELRRRPGRSAPRDGPPERGGWKRGGEVMRVVTLTVGVVGTVSILCVGCNGTGRAQSPADAPKPASASTDGVSVDESMLASLTVAAIAERDTTSALAL